jgi:hypothetical protein
MKNMILGAFAFASALALAATGADKPANAATITETIDFTASGFTPSGAPVDPVIGSFTIKIDPTMNLSGGTTVTFDNVNITPSTIAPFFNYTATALGGDLAVCSPPDGGCTVTPGINSFFIDIINFQSDPLFRNFAYAQSSVPGGVFYSFTGSVSVPAPLAGAGLPGLILACGALLAFARRRRRQLVA